MGLDTVYFPEDPRRAQVTFTSWITEVDKAMAGLDLVVLTSLNEGTPVSLIEAQACGRPVVATRAGGIEDILEEGSTGFTVAQADLEGFAEKLKELIENKALREQMGERGKHFAASRFLKERQVADLEAIYGLVEP